MRYWSSAIRSSAATRRASKSSHESAPREPESPVAGRFSWSVIPPPSLYPGRTTCPGRLHATAEAHLSDAREMLTIDALGGREQLRRQAGRGRLELERDDTRGSRGRARAEASDRGHRRDRWRGT